jgi:hypothetical protein
MTLGTTDIYDEYARAGLRIDHDFIITTQIDGLLKVFAIAANGMTDVCAYYVAKSIHEDGFCQIFRAQNEVSFGATSEQSEYVGSAHDDISTCENWVAYFGEFNITTSIGGCVTAMTVTAPMLVALIDQFSYDSEENLLRIFYDYHFNISRLSCELSRSNVYKAILALYEIASSTIFHVVYFGQSGDRHNGIDSCAFDGADSDQSSVSTRGSRFGFALASNDIESTAPIGGCDTATTTTTTAPTIATTKRHTHLIECWGGG